MHVGHNNPPDPISDTLAPYADAIAEAEGWLDGSPVETEQQMHAVDLLLVDIRDALKALTAAEEGETKPIYDRWKAAKAAYAPTLKDLDRIKKGLSAIAADFRKRLDDERRAAERKARAEAEAARRAAEEAARRADAGSIDDMRAAEEAMQAAKAAQAVAQEASRGRVKGLRTVHRVEVTDRRAALFWIAENDTAALEAFVAAYAEKHARTSAIAGVRVWKEKVAR